MRPPKVDYRHISGGAGEMSRSRERERDSIADQSSYWGKSGERIFSHNAFLSLASPTGCKDGVDRTEAVARAAADSPVTSAASANRPIPPRLAESEYACY